MLWNGFVTLLLKMLWNTWWIIIFFTFGAHLFRQVIEISLDTMTLICSFFANFLQYHFGSECVYLWKWRRWFRNTSINDLIAINPSCASCCIYTTWKHVSALCSKSKPPTLLLMILLLLILYVPVVVYIQHESCCIYTTWKHVSALCSKAKPPVIDKW